MRDEEVGAGVDGLLTTASVGSTARCTRRTGWSRSPATSPTWSQSIAVSGGYTDSSAATTSRSVSGSSTDTSRQCPRPSAGPLRWPDGDPSPRAQRPPGVSDETVEALGKLSEALEVVENARGYLYGFHRPHRDGATSPWATPSTCCARPGHHEIADRIDRELVGRNVIEGRWTFQIVEDYDDGYYALFKRSRPAAREQLVGGRRHLFEAEMKEERRTHGRAAPRGGTEPRT